jgi:mRNA-degrading endonuclease toxin of MazEF toxin-antitoxin module
MERGDIYLVSLDPTSGHEQQGRRPVLIVSPAAFNRLTKTPVVLPITSRGSFVRTAGFAVSLMGVKFPQRYQNSHRVFRNLLCSRIFGISAAPKIDSCLVS